MLSGKHEILAFLHNHPEIKHTASSWQKVLSKVINDIANAKRRSKKRIKALQEKSK